MGKTNEADTVNKLLNLGAEMSHPPRDVLFRQGGGLFHIFLDYIICKMNMSDGTGSWN